MQQEFRCLGDYVEAARVNSGCSSKQALSRHLGYQSECLGQIMRGKAWPGDHLMWQLATLAGGDPVTALAQLNVWRAKTPETREYYQVILQRVMAAAAALFVCLFVSNADLAKPEPNGNKVTGSAVICILWKFFVRRFGRPAHA